MAEETKTGVIVAADNPNEPKTFELKPAPTAPNPGADAPKDAKKSDMTVIIVTILFVMIIVLSIFLYSNYLDYISILEKKVLEAKVIVGDKYGFDVNGTALIFGKIPPGGSTAKREVLITNNYDKPVKVKMNAEGSIKDFIRTSENNFILLPHENKTMVFTVVAPAETAFGTYEGKVTIFIRSALIK